MAPERLAGAAATPAGDWFSWGGALYYAAEGRHPFTSAEVLEAASKGRVPEVRFHRLDREDPVARLVLRCLDPRREERPQSRRAVERVLADLSGISPRRGPPPSAPALGSTALQPRLEEVEEPSARRRILAGELDVPRVPFVEGEPDGP